MSRFTLFFLITWTTQLWAQKDQQHWAAGIYGGISVGYSAFTQPFKDSGAPYVSFASTGWSAHLDGGIAFRNHFGLRLLVGGYSTNYLRANMEQTIARDYPGYVLTYFPYIPIIEKTAYHYAFGVSYAIPKGRWYFQPELLLGSTQAFPDWSTVQVKELGTHQAFILQYTYAEKDARSPTLHLGARASWYAGSYWGFFADTRLTTTWYKLPFRVIKTTVLDQTLTKESYSWRKTASGATANVGIFLQIARWAPKKQT